MDRRKALLALAALPVVMTGCAHHHHDNHHDNRSDRAKTAPGQMKKTDPWAPHDNRNKKKHKNGY